MSTLVTESRVLTEVYAPSWRALVPPPRQSGAGAAAKRGLDIFIAALGMILVAPVILALALLIVVESGWPAIFAQERIGLRGRRFKVYKLRSMVIDAESRLEEIRDQNLVTDGPIFKMDNDPRVTRLGRLLRRLSLDELPQLWNVLTGSMSLVGPRPPLESEVLEYEPHEFQRLAAKPGMTGLWQVSGRSSLTFKQMVDLDLEYVNHWSFWHDVRILARTPAIVLNGKGAL